MKKGIIIGFVLIILVQVISINAKDCGGSVKCDCGDTLTSSQTMWYDLNCPDSGSLTISSSDISLDCAGHSIMGSGLSNNIYGGDRAIEGMDAVWNVTIKNCNISGFSYVAILFASSDNYFLNNYFSHNGRGLVINYGAANNLIQNNTFDYNYRSISFSSGGEDNVIINNIINNSWDWGISLYISNHNLVANNSVSNCYMGIKLWGRGNRITQNNIQDNYLGIWSYSDSYYNSTEIMFNNLINNGISNVINPQYPPGILLAINNWWGTANKSEVENKVSANVSIIPFLCAPYPTNWISDENGNCIFDQDNDGIPDSQDKCPNTAGQQIVYGCSCEQILAFKPGNNNGELKKGCSNGTIDVFTKQIGWAKNLFSQ